MDNHRLFHLSFLLRLLCTFLVLNLVSVTNGEETEIHSSSSISNIISGPTAVLKFTLFEEKNIRKAFDNSSMKDITFFKEIMKELQSLSKIYELTNVKVHRLLHHLHHSGVNYRPTLSSNEENIRSSLWALLRLLEHGGNKDSYRKDFIELSSHLETNITTIVNGLLGNHIFGSGIMVALRDLSLCRGLSLRISVLPVLSLVMAGLWIQGEYERTIGFTRPKNSSFEKFILSSRKNIQERLDKIITRCQDEEKNVVNEMRNIMNSTTGKPMAESLLEFLEDKYDNKRWIVVFLSNVIGPLPPPESNSLTFAFYTTRFYSAQVNQKVAFAFSQEKNVTDTSNLTEAYFKDFKICVPLDLRKKFRYLTIPLWIYQDLRQLGRASLSTDGKWDLDFLVVQSQSPEDITVEASQEAVYFQVPRQQSECSKTYVFIVPTKPITFRGNCSHDPVNDANAGRLYNPHGKGYLSVQGDSKLDGALIVMDPQRSNSLGQKWEFINNTLQNGFGKCLTSNSGWYLYQYECNHDLDSQKWSRQGLRILHARSGSAVEYYDRKWGVINNYVYPQPSFMWYNDHHECSESKAT